MIPIAIDSLKHFEETAGGAQMKAKSKACLCSRCLSIGTGNRFVNFLQKAKSYELYDFSHCLMLLPLQSQSCCRGHLKVRVRV